MSVVSKVLWRRAGMYWSDWPSLLPGRAFASLGIDNGLEIHSRDAASQHQTKRAFPCLGINSIWPQRVAHLIITTLSLTNSDSTRQIILIVANRSRFHKKTMPERERRGRLGVAGDVADINEIVVGRWN